MPIIVTYFRFGFINLKPNLACRTEIEGGQLTLAYAAIRPPVPAAPIQVGPNDTPDAAAQLFGMGWAPRPTRRDMARKPDGTALGQPAALGRADQFQSLNLDFSTNLYCRCGNSPDLCVKKRARLQVTYTAGNHPNIDGFVSPEAKCSEPDGNPTGQLHAQRWEGPVHQENMWPVEDALVSDLLGGNPNQARHDILKKRIEQTAEAAHRDKVGTRKRIVSFLVHQRCPCFSMVPMNDAKPFWMEHLPADPGPRPNDPIGPEEELFDIFADAKASPCDILIEAEYNFIDTGN